MLRRLDELGATSFFQVAWADGTEMEEVVVEPWIEGLWGALETVMEIDNDTTGGDVDDIKTENTVRDMMTVIGSLTASLSSLSLSPLLRVTSPSPTTAHPTHHLSPSVPLPLQLRSSHCNLLISKTAVKL